MRVFLSHAVDPHLDGPVPTRIRAVAAMYNLAVVLPDRKAKKKRRKSQIERCDVFVALVTEAGSELNGFDAVHQEVRWADEKGLPMVALIEDSIDIENDMWDHVVRFDPDRPGFHEKQLVQILDGFRKAEGAPPEESALSALGWVAGLGIGLLGLGALAYALGGGQDDEEEVW